MTDEQKLSEFAEPSEIEKKYLQHREQVYRYFKNERFQPGFTRLDSVFSVVLDKALEKLPDNGESGYRQAELKRHLITTTETALRALYELSFSEEKK